MYLTKLFAVKRIALLAFVIGMMFHTNSFAQHRDQIHDQLDASGMILVIGGDYSKTHNYLVSSMDEGRSGGATFDLKRGMEYAIVGACDNDCADVDMKVFDPYGDLVAEDISDDDKPVVSVEARFTGRYRVVIGMYQCSVEPCYYGVGVFGR